MFNLITIVVGICVLIATSVLSTLVNVDALLPNVVVMMVVYASIHRDGFGALVTTFVLGFVAGLLIAGARGLLLLSLLPVVGMTMWVKQRLQFSGTIATASWVLVASLVADVSFVVLAFVFSPDLKLVATLLRLTPAVALLTALVSIPIFALLVRIEPLLRQRQERTTLF